ncbi:MAG: AtpZ/AtpI family protein [Planctomycetota bacterium]
MDKPTRSNQQRPQATPRVLGAGMTLAVVVGMFAYGGLWLDDRLGSRPWFLLLGVLLGIVGGILHLLRMLAPELLPFARRRKNLPPHR